MRSTDEVNQVRGAWNAAILMEAVKIYQEYKVHARQGEPLTLHPPASPTCSASHSAVDYNLR